MVHLVQEDLSVSLYASLFSALAEGSGFEEEPLYDLFIDGLLGHIRDAVIFAKLPPTLGQVIQLAAHFESLWQENQTQPETPPQTLLPVLYPVPISCPSPGLASSSRPHLALTSPCHLLPVSGPLIWQPSPGPPVPWPSPSPAPGPPVP